MVSGFWFPNQNDPSKLSKKRLITVISSVERMSSYGYLVINLRISKLVNNFLFWNMFTPFCYAINEAELIPLTKRQNYFEGNLER